MKERASSPQTDFCSVWGWEESLVYPSAGLDDDSGTRDQEAAEDEEEEDAQSPLFMKEFWRGKGGSRGDNFIESRLEGEARNSLDIL